MRRFFRIAFALLAVVAVALALGTLVPRPLWPGKADPGPSTRHILVLSNPIHTDIAIPVDAAVLERFGFLADAGMPVELPGARYVIFGWGGRDFYIATPTWADLKPIPLLKGITLDASVMHVEVAGEIAEPQPQIMAFDIGEQQFQALLDFIEASFQKGPDGPIRIPGARYNDYDAFFEANGRFTALAGCNTWTAKALRAAGLRTGWWNPLPPLLTLSMRLYN